MNFFSLRKPTLLACLNFGAAFTPNMAFAAEALTKESLLEGCEIPARREYPVSKEIKPCDDFYGYTCSEVIKSFKLREDRSIHFFALSDSSERLLCAQKKYFSKLPSLPNLSARAVAIRDNYLGCMNEKASAAEEQQLVAQEKKALLGIKTNAALQALLRERMVTPDQSLISFDTGPNQDKPEMRDLFFDGDMLSLPERSYYEKPEVVADLKKLMVTFFKTIKLDHPEKRADTVIAFEKELANVYPLPNDFRKRQVMKNGISSADARKKYPRLGLDIVLDQAPQTMIVRDMEPEAMLFLNDAVAKLPVTTWQNILLFHSATQFMDDAYPEYFNQAFAFRGKHLGGANARAVREERCTKRVMSTFNKEIDAELVDVMFPGFPEERFVKLAEAVRGSIIKGIQDNKWLSDGGRKAAINKMTKAQLQVVKPRTEDEWDFTPPAVYSPNKPYDNKRILRKNLIAKELKEMTEPRKRERWSMGPLTVNAYYSPPDNKFVLPIGILQYPLYDPSIPEEANFAAIGTIIGHELGHGIDDKGSQYDADGKLNNWMSPDDLKEFKSRGIMFVKQFEKVGHNGELTLGENVGDHVGLTFSHHAAFPSGKETAEQNKTFYTQYGRVWCNVARPKLEEMLRKTDPHSAGRERINQQVIHQQGFYDAFSCKEGDKMYIAPKDRIRVW